jgi:ribonuclease HI
MKSPSTPGRNTEIVAHIDGGSRGNPGPAAYGVMVEGSDGAPVAAFSKFLGHTTNNVAEYRGLVAALEYALEHRHLRLLVLTDSELLARQLEGRYKVKSPDLKPLFERARQMIHRFERLTIRHVPREQNADADRLVNQVLDAEESGADHAPRPPASAALQSAATYAKGVLKPHRQLPLFEGEEVDLEIHRKK